MGSSGSPVPHHGVTRPLGVLHEGFGVFGRMFPGLSGLLFHDEPLDLLGGPEGLMHDERRGSEDSDLAAGYAVFAQFVDHDVTLDTGSMLNAPGQNVPEKLKSQWTPSFKLDCVYGFGPESTPMFYDGSRFGMLLDGTGEGRPWDLARSSSSAALVGDSRNDDNLFVYQMQLLWIQFHNSLLLANSGSGEPQDPGSSGSRSKYGTTTNRLFSMICCDASATRRSTTSQSRESNRPSSNNARHSTPRTPRSCLRAIHSCSVSPFTATRCPCPWNSASQRTGSGPRHLLPDELVKTPDPFVGRTSDRHRSLAFRNLARGRSFGLPSSESVFASLAAAEYPMGEVLEPGNLFGSKDFSGKVDAAERAAARAEDGTPLLFYVLREGAVANKGQRLGPVGSAILKEVFGRMPVGCTNSLLLVRHHETGALEEFELDPCVVRSESDGGGTKRAVDLTGVVRFVRTSMRDTHS